DLLPAVGSLLGTGGQLGDTGEGVTRVRERHELRALCVGLDPAPHPGLAPDAAQPVLLLEPGAPGLLVLAVPEDRCSGLQAVARRDELASGHYSGERHHASLRLVTSVASWIS